MAECEAPPTNSQSACHPRSGCGGSGTSDTPLGQRQSTSRRTDYDSRNDSGLATLVSQTERCSLVLPDQDWPLAMTAVCLGSAEAHRPPAARLRAKPRWFFAIVAFLAGCGGGCGGGSGAGTDACPEASPLRGDARDRALAVCMVDADVPPRPSNGPIRPVVKLYIDLSGSMRSFLDPDYSGGQEHYRFALDNLLANLSPVATIGFGDRLRPISSSLQQLGNRDTYRDLNTRMEAALRAIEGDADADTTHIILGDGRRTNPNTANGQYTTMRELVAEWTDRGGTFAVAMSFAPFRPIPGDPAGCHRDATAPADAPLTCPLYAFAFVRAEDANTMAERLVESFKHTFMLPAPAVHPSQIVLRYTSPPGQLAFDRRWATASDGTPIAHSSSERRSERPSAVTVDTGTPDRAAANRLEFVRSLAPHRRVWRRAIRAAQPEWRPVSEAGAHVAASNEDALGLRLLSRGQEAQLFLYRVDLIPLDIPDWLRALDGQDISDRVSTFGLGRLFPTLKRIMEEQRQRVTSVYIAAR